MELAVVVVDGVAALEGNTELVLEERGLDDGANEGDTIGWLESMQRYQAKAATYVDAVRYRPYAMA